MNIIRFALRLLYIFIREASSKHIHSRISLCGINLHGNYSFAIDQLQLKAEAEISAAIPTCNLELSPISPKFPILISQIQTWAREKKYFDLIARRKK